MNGTTPPYATSRPLISPQPSPTSTATSTITVQWFPRARDWVARVVAQTEDRATIAPTERSIPPPVITNVMPTETTPITAASRRMVSALSMLANCSPAVATPTRQSANRATTSPRFRPTDELIRPPRKLLERSRPLPDIGSRTSASGLDSLTGGWAVVDPVSCSDITRHFLP